MSEKRCPRCEETKPLDSFGITRRKRAGGFVNRHQTYCKPCRVQMQTERDRRGGPAKVELRAMRRRAKLRKKYGITPEQHSRQVRAQGGCCAICGRSLDGLSPQTVHVDHCHATGALRGVLCGPCNVGLGSFRDSEETMQAAIEYLRSGGTWMQSVHSEPGSAKLKQVAA